MTGYRVRWCRFCRRRRRMSVVARETDRWANTYRRWRCSRGHTWRVMVSTTENVCRAMKRAFLPALRRALNAENPLLAHLFAGGFDGR